MNKATGRLCCTAILGIFGAAACSEKHQSVSPEAEALIERELRGCFDFFWNETESSPISVGYGLTRDSTIPGKSDFASIAATGFALASYPVGVEKGWITRDEAFERTLGTLKTFESLPQVDGFTFHFFHISSALPYGRTEVSPIDTALFLCGALTAAEYFGGEVMQIFDRIFRRVDWTQIAKPNGRLWMAYEALPEGAPDYQGKYRKFGEWRDAAEQMMMYVFGAGSPSHPISGSFFYGFERLKAQYGGYEYIRSYPNALFVYQFSHGFIDFRGTKDEQGVDWYENSRNATLAARQYAIDSAKQWKTLGKNSWGYSACLGPNGYKGSYGARPNGQLNGTPVDQNDGTVALYAAAASMAFTPEEAARAMLHYAEYPELWGKYGFTDSYNLDHGENGWFCKDCIGIDKGITLVMLANYQNGLIWRLFNQNEYVKAGLKAVGVVKK